MPDTIPNRLRAALPRDLGDGGYASIRYVQSRSEGLSVRQGVVQPVRNAEEAGAMVTVWDGGGLGYAATSDLTPAGLDAAVERAREWARVTSGLGVLAEPPLTHTVGTYSSPVERPWSDTTLAERIELLRDHDGRLGVDERIVDWEAGLAHRVVDTIMVTNGGGEVVQHYETTFPSLRATANEGTNTQTRTYGGHAFCGQGGIEVLDRHGFADAAPRIAAQALELLSAPNCPTGIMDLVLAPDQMILQIHESIGHPLELDRILGDERNYAGTSFVTPDMFGSYRYGSELLNVTFDPTVPGQMASYGFDDDGSPASREYLIREGILQRPMGGRISQTRAGLPGVSNSRACSWNRPPMDRMANLNVEPGESTFEDLISSVERGVYLETNNSWSIDDSRNKFQFGTEYGTMIEDGELTHPIRNPGYRGISATFWRSLSGVGDRSTWKVMGTPNCGKGEPNQVIEVGHAAPVCRFSGVEVFGGEQ